MIEPESGYFRVNTTLRRLAKSAALLGALILAFPAAATACRIDYDGPRDMIGTYGVDVWFDCGVACGNYFNDLASGTSVSRPGKSGRVQTQARDLDSPFGGGYCEAGSRVSVGAHGEVGVTLNGPLDDVTFVWVSKGGNSWTKPVTHTAQDAAKGSGPCVWRGSP